MIIMSSHRQHHDHHHHHSVIATTTTTTTKAHCVSVSVAPSERLGHSGENERKLLVGSGFVASAVVGILEKLRQTGEWKWRQVSGHG